MKFEILSPDLAKTLGEAQEFISNIGSFHPINTKERHVTIEEFLNVESGVVGPLERSLKEWMKSWKLRNGGNSKIPIEFTRESIILSIHTSVFLALKIKLSDPLKELFKLVKRSLPRDAVDDGARPHFSISKFKRAFNGEHTPFAVPIKDLGQHSKAIKHKLSKNQLKKIIKACKELGEAFKGIVLEADLVVIERTGNERETEHLIG